MQRVRCRRRDIAVTVGRGETTLRERRRIVAMNQVVRNTRMIWLLDENRFQHLCRAQLITIRLVVRIVIGGQGERVKNSRLGIVWIFVGELRHRELIGKLPRLRRHLIGIAKKIIDGGDVIALTFGLATELPRAFGCGQTNPKGLARKRPRVRIFHRRHRECPMHHRAIGIGLGGVHERLLHFNKIKRVHQRNRAREIRLCEVIARNRKAYGA